MLSVVKVGRFTILISYSSIMPRMWERKIREGRVYTSAQKIVVRNLSSLKSVFEKDFHWNCQNGTSSRADNIKGLCGFEKFKKRVFLLHFYIHTFNNSIPQWTLNFQCFSNKNGDCCLAKRKRWEFFDILVKTFYVQRTSNFCLNNVRRKAKQKFYVN